MTSLLKTSLLGLAQTAVNSALALDPATLKRLARLEGKILHIEITAPHFDFYLEPGAHGIFLKQEFNEAADARIRGSAAAMTRVLTADNKATALFGKDISISGDMELSQQLQLILANLEIDWEAKLASWFGDVAGHQLGRGVRSLHRFVSRSGESLTRSAEEYLHEESRALPPRAELNHFYSEIEILSIETDRLSARIERLKKALADKDGKPKGSGALE